MTYQDLLNDLKTLNPDQLSQDVTVHLTEVDEFVPVYAVCVAVEDDNDAFDPGHIVLGS
jgi:hypothetical protein